MTALITPGLVSISFRKLSAPDLIAEVVRAGQKGIEWGGDAHAPHGDTATAETVGRQTREAGLEVAAYGSYYRLAETEKNPDFQAVLDSALALGAPTIRVWAGKRGSADADAYHRRAVEEDARRICALAAPHGLRVAFEYHGGTLTDSTESAASLMHALTLDNLDTLWQPPNGASEDECEQSLRAVLPRVSNVHVFHWGPGGWGDRYPLSEGRERWRRYFNILAEDAKPRWALMEFVKGDSLDQYHQDARVLDHLLENKG